MPMVNETTLSGQLILRPPTVRSPLPRCETETVVLTGATLSNNIAVTTDGNGQLVNALDAQVFTVESDDINIGDDNRR